jgi:ADP-ribose pyrophosphatase YjhB (NUDIX family)
MAMTKLVHDSETAAHIHHNFDGVEKVFLAQRAMSKKFMPGVYEILGGHIDFGEEIVAGLKREVREEIKKEIIVGDPFNVFTYMNEVKGAHAVEVAYFAEFVGALDDATLSPDDHMAAGWFSEDEFKTFSVNREADDEELQVMHRGFALLRGESLRFGVAA